MGLNKLLNAPAGGLLGINKLLSVERLVGAGELLDVGAEPACVTGIKLALRVTVVAGA